MRIAISNIAWDVEEDELVEVTPAAIRMRKKILDRNRRERSAKSSS